MPHQGAPLWWQGFIVLPVLLTLFVPLTPYAKGSKDASSPPPRVAPEDPSPRIEPPVEGVDKKVEA